MKSRKVIAIALALALTMSTVGSAGAAEEQTTVQTEHQSIVTVTPRTSAQLNTYSIAVAADGAGTLKVRVNVVGTHRMNEIGVESVVVQCKTASGTWYDWALYETMSSTDSVSYTKTLSVAVVAGKTYRATAVVFATDSDGSDSRTIISGSAVAE